MTLVHVCVMYYVNYLLSFYISDIVSEICSAVIRKCTPYALMTYSHSKLLITKKFTMVHMVSVIIQ